MRRNSKWWIALSVVVVVAAIALGLTLGSSNGNGSTTTTSPSTSNTITFAEAPGAAPNYIFPYLGCQYFSVATLSQFQEMTYRPLYWFGTPGSSAVDYSLSPAKAPVFSNGNKTITIDMKGWKFADGQSVNAESVMFFLNMYKADPTSYCGYNKGYGIPDQVASASGSGNTVVIHFTSAVNPNWILYNYLAELTPMPNSWDVTAPGATSTCASGVYGAASTNSACKAVEKYLDAQAATQTNFADALWTSGADGPWKLIKMDDLGDATFVPNATYSGPVKAQSGIKYVKEEAFTSSDAEQNALNYNLTTGFSWAFNYAPFNFSTKDPKLAIVSQLYVRQALQEAVDQSTIINKVDKGYGVPIDSPLPPNTPQSVSGLAKAIEPVPNPYSFNLTAAKKLLTSHGWQMVNGVDTCESPGTSATECGTGIAKGTSLTLSIIWASGTPALDDTFNAEISDWAAIGIKVSHTEASFNDVIADCEAGTTYEICSWGGGWSYAPDYYPSGETLFAPGGGFNVGSYSNATETSLIEGTTFGTASLKAYAEYTATQLPVLFQPEATATGEVLKTLKAKDVNGVNGLVANPLQNFMPEYLYY